METSLYRITDDAQISFFWSLNLYFTWIFLLAVYSPFLFSWTLLSTNKNFS